MNLDAKIEAILFFKAEPLAIKKLVEITEDTEENVTQAINDLQNKLSDRGVKLIIQNDSVMMGTDPAASALIEKITKDELAKELGKASLETLAIIVYEGPVTRSEIDYIRGVNSSFILRNLMIRGLIERETTEGDSRRFAYKPTFALLQHLGITETKELPEFEDLKSKIEKFKAESEKQEEEKENVNEEESN